MLSYVRNVEVLFTVLALAMAILRNIGHRTAQFVTVAGSILLMIWVPFGTGVFVYWLLSVRKKERA